MTFNFLYVCLSFASGAIAVTAWAPLGWYPVGLTGFAILFYLVRQSKTALEAGLYGALFGLGLHGFGHGWAFTALHSKAGMSLFEASIGMSVFLIYLSAHTALPSILFKLVRGRNAQRLAFDVSGFAGLLTLGEWVRSQLFNGFTSLSLGYSLLDTWLAGVLPILGLYGLSFLGFYLSGLLAILITTQSARKPALAKVIGVLSLAWLSTQITWTQPFGPPVTFKLIQLNVPQTEKFEPQYQYQHASRLVDLITASRADLIITPETAFTMFMNEVPPELVDRLRYFSRSTESHLFLGVATQSASSDGYNSMLHFRPNSIEGRIAQYNKIYLMPFGEYSPAGFSWFTDKLQVPLKDMSAGDIDQKPFEITKGAHTQRIGTLICHDDLTSALARYWAPSAGLLINPGNLAWFENSLAIPQRLEIVRVRAMEIGRPILRTANTGDTAHIAANGKVIKQLPVEQTGVLDGEVQPMTGLTPFTSLGNYPALALCVIAIIALACEPSLRRVLRRPELKAD